MDFCVYSGSKHVPGVDKLGNLHVRSQLSTLNSNYVQNINGN